MKRVLAAVAAVGLVATLSACAGPEPEWDEIPADGQVLKEYVDESAAVGDCDALQETFDVWANYTNADGMHLTGVMTYIDDAMREAGCHE